MQPRTAAAGRYRRALQGATIASGTARTLGVRRLLRHGGDDEGGDDFGGRGFWGGRGVNCSNDTSNGTFIDDDSDDNSSDGTSNSTSTGNSTDAATTDVLNGTRC